MSTSGAIHSVPSNPSIHALIQNPGSKNPKSSPCTPPAQIRGRATKLITLSDRASRLRLDLKTRVLQVMVKERLEGYMVKERLETPRQEEHKGLEIEVSVAQLK